MRVTKLWIPLCAALCFGCGDDAGGTAGSGGSGGAGGTGGTPSNTIVDVVVSNDDFSTLEELVIAEMLVETLSGDGPFTVFAPPNSAFAALPAGTLENLQMNDLVDDVLTYHVVPGLFLAADVLAEETLTTVQGEDITVDSENVTVNGIDITMTDLEVDNGVIHIIDGVLVPPSLSAGG